jgi:flagellar basal body-associated protein FliL
MENNYQPGSLQQEYERQKVQQKKKNRRIVFIIMSCVLVFIIGITTLVLTIMKNSDKYDVAQHYILNDAKIQSETGGVKDLGSFPSGTINISNGYGTANLGIHVNGKKKDIEVLVYLEKRPASEWKVVHVQKE